MLTGTTGSPVTGLSGVLMTEPNTPRLTICTVMLLVAVLPSVSVTVAVIW
jgi:hypothetical protein